MRRQDHLAEPAAFLSEPTARRASCGNRRLPPKQVVHVLKDKRPGRCQRPFSGRFVSVVKCRPLLAFIGICESWTSPSCLPS